MNLSNLLFVTQYVCFFFLIPLKKLDLHIGQVKNRMHLPSRKSTSLRLSETTFFAHRHSVILPKITHHFLIFFTLHSTRRPVSGSRAFIVLYSWPEHSFQYENSLLQDWNTQIRKIKRLAVHHFRSKKGNWAELAFTRISWIVIEDALVSFWQIKLTPAGFLLISKVTIIL